MSSSLHKPSASTSSNASQYPLPSLCSSVSSTTSSIKSFPLTRTGHRPTLLHPDLPKQVLALTRRQKQQKQQQQKAQYQPQQPYQSPWGRLDGERNADQEEETVLRHVSFDEAIVVIPADIEKAAAAGSSAPAPRTDNPAYQVMDATIRMSHDSAETLSSQWWDDSLALELAEDDFMKKKTRRFRPRWFSAFARPPSFLSISKSTDATSTGISSLSSSSGSDGSDTHTPSRCRYPSARSTHLMSQSLQKLKSLLSK